MRYSATEKLEIIELVGQSNLPQRRCLASLGIPRQTFYRWYDRYLTGGPEALADRPSRPDRERIRSAATFCRESRAAAGTRLAVGGDQSSRG